jgi:hypothetical protein
MSFSSIICIVGVGIGVASENWSAALWAAAAFFSALRGDRWEALAKTLVAQLKEIRDGLR